MWKSRKIKSVKNVIIKKVSYEKFSSLCNYSIRQLYFGTQHQRYYQHCTVIVQITQITISRLKKSYSNDKLLEKITSSSYRNQLETSVLSLETKLKDQQGLEASMNLFFLATTYSIFYKKVATQIFAHSELQKGVPLFNEVKWQRRDTSASDQ